MWRRDPNDSRDSFYLFYPRYRLTTSGEDKKAWCGQKSERFFFKTPWLPQDKKDYTDDDKV